MLPRWHIFWGAIFSLLIYFLAEGIHPAYILLIFFSSFLIDFDHYAFAVYKTGKIGLQHAFDYYRDRGKQYNRGHSRGIYKKGDFHVFHTVEFHGLVAIIGLFITPLFFIFVGMVFHSLLDIGYMLYHGVMYRREFFFFNWLRKKF